MKYHSNIKSYSDVLVEENISERLETDQNDLNLNARLYRDTYLDKIKIYAKSPFIFDNVRVTAAKKSLFVQVGVEVEVKKPYYISGNEQNSYVLKNSAYAIIKSSKIRLPGDSIYKLEYYQIIQPGLLLISLVKWRHNF